MTSFENRNSCRLCLSKNIQVVLEMTPTPIGDAYRIEKTEMECFPVNLCLCNECGNAQLAHIVNPKEIYTEYIYKTSDSLGLVKHFEESVKSILNQFDFNLGSLVVDIGSNDGSFLELFKKKGMRVVGIEPAKSVSEIANNKGILTKNNFFNINIAEQIKLEKGEADIIISNNTFANVDNLTSFIKSVKNLLSQNGIFVIETGYIVDLLNKNIFDNIYHEHLNYFSVKPLKKFFEFNGMKLINVERIASKGGSIRCFAQKKEGHYKESDIIRELIRMEEILGVHRKDVFIKLGNKIKEIKDYLKNYLIKLKNENKKIAGYGASVGVTTIIYNLELEENLIDFLVDDNKDRIGLISPGKNLKVKSKEDLLNENIDYFVNLAWMYNEPIIKNNIDFLNKGGKIITFLPEMKIIDKDYKLVN